jgi:predicted dehydrogenase
VSRATTEATAGHEPGRATGTRPTRAAASTPTGTTPPRLGFVGLGWIGRLRLEAVASAGAGAVVALCEPLEDRLGAAAEGHPDAATFRDVRGLLDAAERLDLDGVVIATPNALHVEQARAALERGLAVFVQKPIGTGAEDVEALVADARRADRRLGVDYAYRHLAAAERARTLVRDGALGEVFFAEAEFHNAYGPDKAWCFDPDLSGGGAFMDLGVHLVDLSLWLLGGRPEEVRGWARDLPGHPGIDGFSAAEVTLDSGARSRIAASWHAHAGRDCIFRVVVHGSDGSAEIRNVDGSFYDFELCLRRGRSEEIVVRDSRDWMDRGIVAWARDVVRDPGYDSSADGNVEVARVVDRVYGRDSMPPLNVR